MQTDGRFVLVLLACNPRAFEEQYASKSHKPYSRLEWWGSVREQAGYLADFGPNMLGQRLHQAAAKFQQCL
jgi:hypothetical protein